MFTGTKGCMSGLPIIQDRENVHSSRKNFGGLRLKGVYCMSTGCVMQRHPAQIIYLQAAAKNIATLAT
jgi:hypothetical protein